jgi:GDP-mannose 6-dehydrogenase
MVELAEKLIGKGYDLSIYDKEVSIAKIYGSNKKYIERVIPHISSLMEESLSQVIKKSEVIVVTKITEEIEKLLAKLKGNKMIIDLAKLSLAQRKRDNGGYEGICW